MPENSVFKDNLFAGKKVLITGGATGMGLGFAQAFLNHGAEVFIASRKEEKLAEAASETKKKFGKKLLWKTVDVRNNETAEDVAEFLSSEWGELDILVNNAAGNFVAPIAAMSENAWSLVFDIVLDGTFRVSKACYPLLRKAKNGASIVNIIANYSWNAAPFVGHSGVICNYVDNRCSVLCLSKERIASF
jgi:peroxisomal 2,4-dienoyl-CoA reductase